MNTKIEMPDNLPPLPPVPEGYDRWEYRGKGASRLKRYAYYCYEAGHLGWLGQVRTDDMVNSPPHYTTSSIECIDAIRAALTPEEFRGFCKGNALKYIWREKHKGGDQDLAKAAWYLNRIKQEKP